MPLDVHRGVPPTEQCSIRRTHGLDSIVFGVIISVPGLICRSSTEDDPWKKRSRQAITSRRSRTTTPRASRGPES